MSELNESAPRTPSDSPADVSAVGVSQNIVWEDAQEMRRRFPETFEAPTEDDILEIVQDYYVRVCFVTPVPFEHEGQMCRGERIWVRVTDVMAENDEDSVYDWIFRGIIEDEPIAHAGQYPAGTQVEFRGRNIYSLIEPGVAMPTSTQPHLMGA